MTMDLVFYISSAVAILATVLAISRLDPVHALLYLIVSLLAVAMVFLALGAPFVAALEVIVYAGAIMVLFVFVVMMLNLGARTREQERRWLRPGMWVVPAILAAILTGEVVCVLFAGGAQGMIAGAREMVRAGVGAEAGASAGAGIVGPREVGLALYGPYVLGVELASMLLLAGLVGAYHLGRRIDRDEKESGR
jgi:NADH-quinone oxidoreductase subunit J